jgi:small-conductance mechanosensitive channel
MLVSSDVVDSLEGAFSPESVTGTDLVAAAVALLVAWLLSRIVARAVAKYVGRPGGHSQQVAKLVARVARWVILAIGLAVALSFLGLDLGWMTVTLAVLLVIGFLAARPLIEGLSAGLALTARPAFGIDDDVKIDEFEGRVIEITARSTVLRLRDGRLVHLPNTDVVSDAVVVLTHDETRRTSLEIEVDDRCDLAVAKQTILAALGSVDAIVDDPAPQVRARGFGQASVRLSARFWHKSDIASEVSALDQAVCAVHEALRKAGIDMSTPRVEEVHSDGSDDHRSDSDSD